MEQTLFETKFSSIMKKLDEAQSFYDFKAGETWDNVGTNPLDVALTELSELYLEADTTQREYIFEQAAIAKLPYNLWYFIRRVAKHIQSQEDTKWLEIGLAASRIDGARADFRDLIISLVLLRFTAEIHEIDTKLFFDNAIQNSDDKLKPILLNARDHSEPDVHSIVQTFGWPELMEESIKKFGEHPSVAEARRRREANPNTGTTRQINCSTVLIVLLIVILILGVTVFLFLNR
jgi:hypothetical protein